MFNPRRHAVCASLRRAPYDVGQKEMMNKSDKYIKESVIFAAAISAVSFVVYFVQELVGFNKMNPAATPKTLPEVLAESPRLIGFAALIFVGALWWKMSQKEKETWICVNCKEPVEKEETQEKTAEKTCQKCGGRLEALEGFYDRHPEKR